MAFQVFENLGVTEQLITMAAEYPELCLGRVSEQHKNIYKVITAKAEVLAKVSGRYVYMAADKSAYPVVGDWVLLIADTNEGGEVIIQNLLPRRTTLQRKDPGTQEQAQVLVANIDIVFICMALNNDFNVRRLERYLAIAWDSGATPVVVLTKKDICTDLADKLAEVETVALGVDVLLTANTDIQTVAAVQSYLTPGKTAVFVGSSGVGKSTLINMLMGKDILLTNGLRNDDKGRHTTTGRQLIVLPAGGMVVDTPGLREIQIDTGDLDRTFQDIESLAKDCRFSDCRHDQEPGCAVRAAIDSGQLDPERLASYQKLSRETAYQTLNSRQIENKKLEHMFGSKAQYKQMMKEFKKDR